MGSSGIGFRAKLKPDQDVVGLDGAGACPCGLQSGFLGSPKDMAHLYSL